MSTGSYTPSTYGFVLAFHPDLLRNFELGKNIRQYSFFGYDVHEALHLSKREEDLLVEIAANIRTELEGNIDRFSQEVIVSNIQLMLNYSKRFYERQFITRTHANSDVVSQMERLVFDYIEKEMQLQDGIPSPEYFTQNVHLSKNYLSDLLKKETGRSTKEHVDDHIVELAKNELLSTSNTVNEIAYHLGFNYPHYFSRMFKKKPGISPAAYRSQPMS